MISDAQIAALQVAVYDPAPLAFDHYACGAGRDGICWGIKRVDDTDVIVLRGSVTFRDWLRDFAAWADPLEHGAMGPVHPGFLLGMPAAWQAIRPLLRGQRAIVAGHSLGAGRAAILTGLMVLDGRPPAARVVFGEPKPGFVALAKVIEGVPARSYRNGDGRHHDYVTDVPFSFPPEQYVHPTPVVTVCGPPTGDLFSRLGVFAWHHMPLYFAALSPAAAAA